MTINHPLAVVSIRRRCGADPPADQRSAEASSGARDLEVPWTLAPVPGSRPERLPPDGRALLWNVRPRVSLYFASQGAGRLLWPLLGSVARLAIAALAGWLAVRWTGDLSHVFVAQSLALIASGFINVTAVAGAWFGSLTWPWSTAAALQRRSAI
jgi:hypothetical protein